MAITKEQASRDIQTANWKLRYYEDKNFTSRQYPAPILSDHGFLDKPAPRSNETGGRI